MNTSENNTSSKSILNMIIDDRKSILSLILLSLFFSFILNFILPKKYIAEMSITQSSPNMTSGLGNVSSIASSFGINLNNMKGDVFYLPNIIQSNSLKKSILQKDRLINDNPTNLSEYYNNPLFSFQELNDDEKLINSIKVFSDNLIVLEDQNSGMITVKFISDSSSLSENILNDITEYLNKFLNSGINLQASSMLQLINEEISITKDELNEIEDQLASFVDKNRSYFDSPNLVLQYKRFERDIEILNQKYVNLIIQQTMAMIEEKKQLPKLNIISDPISDTEPYSPNLINIFFVILTINLGLYFSRAISKVSTAN
tara:strand:+ start:8108 stop:9055 length:948 start_codon:yes stop_codon:yes gene_type:complete